MFVVRVSLDGLIKFPHEVNINNLLIDRRGVEVSLSKSSISASV